MPSPLPLFRYHPDPLASGSVVASAAPCACCGETRGLIYAGPVFSAADEPEEFCPWCIASGDAHAKFEATFFDEEALDETIPAAVAAEICTRTPGYAAWQQGRWPACCGDAAEFLAPVGARELRTRFHQFEAVVLSHVIHELQISGSAARRFLESLDRAAGPTAYLFRCRRCVRPHVHVDYP